MRQGSVHGQGNAPGAHGAVVVGVADRRHDGLADLAAGRVACVRAGAANQGADKKLYFRPVVKALEDLNLGGVRVVCEDRRLDRGALLQESLLRQ